MVSVPVTHDDVPRIAANPDTAEQLRIFEGALAATQDFLYVFGLDGRFLYANRALCELLNRSLSEVVGRDFFELDYPTQLAATLQHQIQNVIATGAAVRAETLFTAPDGTTSVYEYIFNPMLDDSGTVTAVAGTTRDISESSRVREELAAANLALAHRVLDVEERNATIHRLVDQAPGFTAVLQGPEHVFVMVNQAYNILVGKRPVIGKTVREAFPETVEQGFVGLLDDVLRTGKPFVGHAVPLTLNKLSDAKPVEVFVDFVYQPIVDENGVPTGVFVQGHEVTEQYVARQELLAADRQKDSFIATLAHELRNPLGPIRNAAALLRTQTSSPETVARASGIISRQVSHMARLLDDLLDVARLRNGQMVLQPETVDPDEIVRLAIETAWPWIEEKHHHFAEQNSVQDVTVTVDAARLAQVIMNLLTNAAKYTPAGGKIHLSSRVEQCEWVVSVTDNGMGLAPDALARVFNMFAQEQPSLGAAQSGLGIGLAISRQLIGLHGGRLVAHSEGPGLGSTFSIHIPQVLVRSA